MNEDIFPAAWRQGVQAYIPDADVRFFDNGRFALETHAGEIAESIRNFLLKILLH